jgi:hypothetical protein
MVSEILIFKTNIHTENDVGKIAHFLNSDLHVKKWNVDRDDVDRVLRIECDDHNPDYIIHVITNAGFRCEELLD